MSLINKFFVGEEKLAANQASGRQSRGPATEEARGRIRATDTRHGYYSQARGLEMHVLGEDPDWFERLSEPLTKLKAGSNEVRRRRQGRKKYGISHDVIESK